MLRTTSLLATALVCSAVSPAFATLTFDDNVTNNAIFGTGNANGGWTVFRDAASGIELGLRAKVRFPTPLNVFNSDGAGTYTHQAGLAGPDMDDAAWNFEWSINQDYNGNGSDFGVGDISYEITLDLNPSPALNIPSLVGDPLATGAFFGDNSTPESGGLPSLLPPPNTNLAQNSSNYGFIPGAQAITNDFAPGEYEITLSAFDGSNVLIGTTAIIVSAVPEAGAVLLWTLTSAGLGTVLLRRQRGATATEVEA